MYIPSKELLFQKFLVKAHITHKGIYTYPFPELYVDCLQRFPIQCSTHGIFWQTPTQHLKGRGCRKCGSYGRYNDKESFIVAANLLHSNLYTYPKVNYIDCNTEVAIECKIHGEFYQTPNVHMSGSGCQKCANEKISKFFTKNRETFITEANILHDNRYIYDCLKYINAQSKEEIGCPVHGYFLQTPAHHLQGHGCQKCNGKSVNERLVGEYLDLFKIHNQHLFATRINGRLHIFDFYLPYLNIMIEYNGLQHYKPVCFARKTPENIKQAQMQFADRQIRDEEKRQYCKLNKITLLEIDGRIINGKQIVFIFLDDYFSKLT